MLDYELERHDLTRMLPPALVDLAEAAFANQLNHVVVFHRDRGQVPSAKDQASRPFAACSRRGRARRRGNMKK